MKLRRIRGEMYSSFRMLRVKNCNHKYIIFKGKRSVNWKDAREYLKKYVGEFYTIASTGDVVYVGSDLPSEYSGSLYTKKLNGTVAKAKANATQGNPELLEIAVGKHFRENSGDKHNWNAKYGWYRYDSRFALPVYNELWRN